MPSRLRLRVRALARRGRNGVVAPRSESALRTSVQECAVAAFGDDAHVRDVSLREHRIEWDHDGYRGFAANVTLRSGLELCLSEGRAERALSIPFEGSVSELVFTLSRGTGITYVIDEGPTFVSGGGTLEVTSINQSVAIESTLAAGAHNEFVVLSLTEKLMCELLAVPALPDVVQRVLSSEDAYSRACVPMSVELFRLLDELLRRATEGQVRQLYLEAKGLELIARIFERLEQQAGEIVAAIPNGDVARLHHVRDTIVARMTDPPSLEALARQVGLSQTRLKTEFRALFGVPVFAYLRDYRLSEAYRLLIEGELNVTQVAMKVGYANPSKFAAAFRKQFGLAPTDVRSQLARQRSPTSAPAATVVATTSASG